MNYPSDIDWFLYRLQIAYAFQTEKYTIKRSEACQGSFSSSAY